MIFNVVKLFNMVHLRFDAFGICTITEVTTNTSLHDITVK